jgi:hypothetical protein
MAHAAQYGRGLTDNCEFVRWPKSREIRERQRIVHARDHAVLLLDAAIAEAASVSELEEWYGSAHPEPSPAKKEPDQNLVTEFAGLVKKWRLETAGHSILLKKVMHPSYQQIIGMGEEALPLVLREMQRLPSHWFWALDAITRGKVNPAKDSKNLEDAAKAWIDWGRSAGHL